MPNPGPADELATVSRSLDVETSRTNVARTLRTHSSVGFYHVHHV